MITLAKNSDNDIFASAGRIAIAEDDACRSVIVDSVVKTQRGELQFDVGKGIDYFGTVFQNPKYITIWAGQVKREIQKLDWVRDIEDFQYSFNRQQGSLNWSMTVSSAYGDTVKADSNGTFLFRKGDGKMGIRWEDIVDKPEGLDEAIGKMLDMQAAVSKVGKLEDASTITETKTAVNSIRDGIVGGVI